MPFQSVPGTASVEIRYRLGSTNFENVMYFRRTSGYGQADVDALAMNCYLVAESGLLPYISSDIALREVYVRGLEFQNDLEAYYADVVEPTGGIGNPSLPLNVAFAIKFSAGLTGRSTRGRNYIAGAPESQVSGNLVSPVWAENIKGGVEAISGASIPDGWTHVIVSRVANGVVRPTGVTFAVTSITYTDLTVDTMRKRLT